VQASALAFLISLGLIRPPAIVQKHVYNVISLAIPPTVNHEPQRIPHKLQQAPKIRQSERPEVAKLEAPKVELPVRKPAMPEVKPVAPKVVVPANFPVLAAERQAPKLPPQVKSAGFSTGSSAPPTAVMDAHKVQTGGFGDPNGVPANPNNNSGKVNIAAAGLFDLPAGSGYGNGSGGSHGARVVVASAGFGNGVATGTGGGRSGGIVKTAGFTESEPVKLVAKREETPKADTLPVQIISKPTPAYTPDARAAKIEGEVLLEVVFSASGKLQVVRVVRGLGHGLDESAIRAAEQIRYKPATRGGSPIDSSATLHIVFQMA
jgi:TonB family protein